MKIWLTKIIENLNKKVKGKSQTKKNRKSQICKMQKISNGAVKPKL